MAKIIGFLFSSGKGIFSRKIPAKYGKLNVMKKRIFLFMRIEHILFTLAIISICSTIYFKYTEASKFQALLNKIEYAKENSGAIYKWEAGTRDAYFSELKKTFEPFTFYNEEVDDCLTGFIFSLTNPGPENRGEIISTKYIQLYKLLYQQQQQLNFGYVWSLLISFFITMVSLFSISEKERIKKNEFRVLSIINENQLKLTREIHDGIAQDLAALKISIQNRDDEKTAFFADQAFSEVRFLLENTHINLNEDFIANLKNILFNFERHFGIHTELFLASEHIRILSTNYRFQMVRILNEALSNVARHSEARNVIIRITDTMKGLHFIISDDGIGNRSLSRNDGQNHYGIENIKGRVAEMNGSVTFDFTGGTTIAISIEDFIS